LTELETSLIEGGSWLSFGLGYAYEAVKYYGGQAYDWIGRNYRGNETLMNCI
jgi:hypothetical protein